MAALMSIEQLCKEVIGNITKFKKEQLMTLLGYLPTQKVRLNLFPSLVAQTIEILSGFFDSLFTNF